MELSKIPLFAAFKSQLTWAVDRQHALAQNVANADTPGYRPLDIKRPEFKDFLTKAGPGTCRRSPTSSSAVGRDAAFAETRSS